MDSGVAPVSDRLAQFRDAAGRKDVPLSSKRVQPAGEFCSPYYIYSFATEAKALRRECKCFVEDARLGESLKGARHSLTTERLRVAKCGAVGALC